MITSQAKFVDCFVDHAIHILGASKKTHQKSQIIYAEPMPPNFLVYQLKDIRKVNSQRRALSQPTLTDVPVLAKGQVQYIPEAQMKGEPASCYGCPRFNYEKSCRLMGDKIAIRKFVYPKEATADAKRIEYWPCCSGWEPGEPNYGKPEFAEELLSPETLGLIWINAPEVGQAYGGANCGGKDGGDDCDHFITKGDDKRAEPMAFCRVLQSQVENGAVCSAWQDDDEIDWQRAQNILKEPADDYDPRND
jgi:hypothetical protein